MIEGGLIGKKINKIFMNKEYLRFETDAGNVTFTIYGDCCSYSFFYDFYGVGNLLKNGRVKEFKEVQLDPLSDNEYGCTSVYGFQITTESEEFGEMTSVFSFRNESNGYYGGWMEDSSYDGELPEIKEDVIEIK